MAQTMSNFDAALKIEYLPVIRKQLNNDTILMKRIQRDTESVVGKYAQLTLSYQRQSGIGARADAGTLPSAGYQGTLNSTIGMKYNYARIEVSSPTMAASRGAEGSVVQALNFEIDNAVSNLKKDINFQLVNDGTCQRALVNGTATSTTVITVDTPGTKYLSDGMVIDIWNGTSLQVDSATIASVDSDTQITLSASTTAANNAVIVREDSRAYSGGTWSYYEMMGLKGIVNDDTGTFQGLSRNSYAWWKSSNFTNDDGGGTNRDLTLALMQEAVTNVEKKPGKVSLILGTHELRDKYIDLLVADKRYVNTMELDGGFSAVAFNGIPFVVDSDAYPNEIYFLDESHLMMFLLKDFDWMDQDGAVLSRVSGKASYEAILEYYANFGSDGPRYNSFLKEITES